MFGQTFATSDIAIVGVLVLLEGLLSADNALVLALMVRHLDIKQQRKALSLGLSMSFAFRFVAILLASIVLKLWWLQAIGGLYLIFLVVKHFLPKKNSKEEKERKSSFTMTIVALGITDLAFALDSVLAAVATVRGHDKIWVIVLGALLGIVALRYSASAFIKLLDRFPALDHVAYCLVGWAGVKLLFESLHTLELSEHGNLPFHVPEMSQAVFWSVMGVIAIGGTLLAIRKGQKEPFNSPDSD